MYNIVKKQLVNDKDTMKKRNKMIDLTKWYKNNVEFYSSPVNDNTMFELRRGQ